MNPVTEEHHIALEHLTCCSISKARHYTHQCQAISALGKVKCLGQLQATLIQRNAGDLHLESGAIVDTLSGPAQDCLLVSLHVELEEDTVSRARHLGP
jgi:hypothetical protein